MMKILPIDKYFVRKLFVIIFSYDIYGLFGFFENNVINYLVNL